MIGSDMFGKLNNLYGFIVYENSFLTKEIKSQSRFPRTHKKRIEKKFSKKYSITTIVPDNNVIVDSINRRIYVHPEMRVKIEQLLS